MLSVLLIPLTYSLGYLISHYSIEEIKGKQELFQKLVKVSIIALVIASFYAVNNYVQIIIPFVISAIILFKTPDKYIKSIKDLLTPIFIGIVISALFNSYYVILLACFVYFFKSNYDYLNKKFIFTVWKEILVLLVFFFTSLFFINYFNNTMYNLFLIAASLTGLLRLLRL